MVPGLPRTVLGDAVRSMTRGSRSRQKRCCRCFLCCAERGRVHRTGPSLLRILGDGCLGPEAPPPSYRVPCKTRSEAPTYRYVNLPGRCTQGTYPPKDLPTYLSIFSCTPVGRTSKAGGTRRPLCQMARACSRLSSRPRFVSYQRANQSMQDTRMVSTEFIRQ
ncbi:hypothetical protein LY76DRAFT_261247 [Colletotrichum caudatum]|nr:hypothetical protein LY76DRAFT_261247 [Colletotrichum caudatum]